MSSGKRRYCRKAAVHISFNIYIYISINFKKKTYFSHAKYGTIKSQFIFFEGEFMRTKKILHRAIAVLSAVIIVLAGCGQTEEAITETAPETAIVTTTTAVPETSLITIAETTIITTTAETIVTETEAATEAETQKTTEAKTEATTIATTTSPKTTPAVVPVTTADNSGDTRSTQQKLDDIIAANPNVEIGYALYNTDTDKYLFHYNDEMEIDVSGEVPIYWLYLLLESNEVEKEVMANFRKQSYDNSYVFDAYSDGEYWFKIGDLINYYFYDQDLGSKATLEREIPLVYGKNININGNIVWIREKDGTEKSSITEYIAKWIAVNEFVNENSDESKFFNKLLKNSDRDSFFYEGTGVLTVHAGDKIGSDCYDTGIINVGGTDYIFVIYTRNAGSADIVREISRFFYDDLT
jgi:hypothetical protein